MQAATATKRKEKEAHDDESFPWSDTHMGDRGEGGGRSVKKVGAAIG